VLFFLGYLFALHTLPAVKQNPASATANLVQENLSVGAERTGPPETTQQLLESFSYLSTHPSPTFLSGIPEMPDTPEVVMLHKGGPSDLPEGEDHTQSWTPATDLIVWPEAPSGFFTSDPNFVKRMHELADSSHALLIVGSLGEIANPLPNPDRPYLLYDSGAGDMDRGTLRMTYRQNGHVYAAFVCYESIFGDEIRQFVKKGAEVLVNISDDGWYGDTGAAWQHLNMVRMRAIENHRWILRSTNTGVTAAIDPAGHVTVAAPRHVRTSLHAAFGYEDDTTFYTQHGDLFAYGCAMIAAFAAFWSLVTGPASTEGGP
jgi:apolipoprotein N-acyltransferase